MTIAWPSTQCCRDSASQVPALVLQSGVLRCRVPPHPPGVVRICLTNGDGRPRSRLHPFEYRDAPDPCASAPNRRDLQPRHRQGFSGVLTMQVCSRLGVPASSVVDHASVHTIRCACKASGDMTPDFSG